MVNTRLIHRLAFGVWAMEPARANAFMPLVTRLLKGDQPTTGIPDKAAFFGEPLTEDQRAQLMGVTFLDENNQPIDTFGQNIAPTVRNLVAVLPIQDVILKYDAACGPYGMETVARWHAKYDMDPRIAAIVLDIDSPGGEGSGMNTMIGQLAQRTKPVLASISSGMAASAAYGIACACDGIYVSSSTDELGSIGTYVTLADWKKYYEAEGLMLHEVYATKSTEKNLDFRKALEGDYEALRQNYIDPFNEAFLAHVQHSRKHVTAKSSALSGRLYYAEEAQALGLCDGTATRAQVAEMARTQAKAKNPSGSSASHSTVQPKPTTMNLKELLFGADKTAVKLSALSGVNSSELTPEQIAQVDKELSEAGIALFTVATSERFQNATSLVAALDAAEENVRSLSAQLVELNAKVQAADEAIAASAMALTKIMEDNNVSADEGQSPSAAIAEALATRTNELGQARTRIQELEQVDTTEGLKTPVNTEGDRRGSDEDPALAEFRKESTKIMQRLR